MDSAVQKKSMLAGAYVKLGAYFLKRGPRMQKKAASFFRKAVLLEPGRRVEISQKSLAIAAREFKQFNGGEAFVGSLVFGMANAGKGYCPPSNLGKVVRIFGIARLIDPDYAKNAPEQMRQIGEIWSALQAQDGKADGAKNILKAMAETPK